MRSTSAMHKAEDPSSALSPLFMDIIWFLFIGFISGWLAGLIMGSGSGIIGDIIVGIVGSFIGGYLLRILHITPYGGTVGSIITAVIGAVVLIAIVRMVRHA